MNSPLLTALALTALAAFLPTAEPAQDPAPFSEAAPVRGVVVDEGGVPQAGVRYWVSGYEQRDGGSWVVTHFTGATRFLTTNTDGRFELPGRTLLRYDVSFDAPGFAPTRQVSVEPGAQLRVVLHKGRTVSGRLVQIVDGEERPIPGERIAVRRPNPRGLWFKSERETGPGGSFEFRDFLPADEGGPPWQLVHGGAVLPLASGEGPIEVQIEIRMVR